MKTKKQVFFVFADRLSYENAITHMLSFDMVFNGLKTAKNYYIRISQKTFKRYPYLDLYLEHKTFFSSVI